MTHLREENCKLKLAQNAVTEGALGKLSYHSDVVWVARYSKEESNMHAPDFMT